MIEYVTGDLFDPKFWFDGIAHGVNCKGAMGSGIAPRFKTLHPMMYNKYNSLCMQGVLLPGQVFPWKVENPGQGEATWIYNIASQYYPGPDARLDALASGLYYVRYHAKANGLARVGLPRIGAGIGGLNWEDVQMVAKSLLEKSAVTFTFVSLEGADN